MKKRIYKQNRNAPRVKRAEFTHLVINKHLWRAFINENPDFAEMTYSRFRECWAAITKTIMKEAITNPLGVKLPNYLGEIKFQFLPYKFEAFDRDLSYELEEPIKFINISTIGKVGKVKWERRQAVRFNRILQFYSFSANARFCKLAKERVEEDPHSVRVSMVTMGRRRVWK